MSAQQICPSCSCNNMHEHIIRKIVCYTHKFTIEYCDYKTCYRCKARIFTNNEHVNAHHCCTECLLIKEIDDKKANINNTLDNLPLTKNMIDFKDLTFIGNSRYYHEKSSLNLLGLVYYYSSNSSSNSNRVFEYAFITNKGMWILINKGMDIDDSSDYSTATRVIVKNMFIIDDVCIETCLCRHYIYNDCSNIPKSMSSTKIIELGYKKELDRVHSQI